MNVRLISLNISRSDRARQIRGGHRTVRSARIRCRVASHRRSGGGERGIGHPPFRFQGRSSRRLATTSSPTDPQQQGCGTEVQRPDHPARADGRDRILRTAKYGQAQPRPARPCSVSAITEAEASCFICKCTKPNRSPCSASATTRTTRCCLPEIYIEAPAGRPRTRPLAEAQQARSTCRLTTTRCPSRLAQALGRCGRRRARLLVREGEVHGFGPNGAGKFTTPRILAR